MGTGTIEIGYHVWWDEDGPGMAAESRLPIRLTACNRDKKAKWHSAKETLTVTVVAVD